MKRSRNGDPAHGKDDYPPKSRTSGGSVEMSATVLIERLLLDSFAV